MKVRGIIKSEKGLIELQCCCCQKPLYVGGRFQGNYVELSKDRECKKEIVDIFLTCKDSCIRKIDQSYFERGFNPIEWRELSDLAIPELFLQHVNYMIDQLNKGACFFSEEALKKEKEVLSIISQCIYRSTTKEEQKRLKVLRNVGLL